MKIGEIPLAVSEARLLRMVGVVTLKVSRLANRRPVSGDESTEERKMNFSKSYYVKSIGRNCN